MNGAQVDYVILIKFFIFVFGAIFIAYLIMARGRLTRYIRPRKNKLAPELWLYSSLVDMELGSAPQTAQHLSHLFFSFLKQRYNLPNSKPDTAFRLVKEREEDPRRIDFYGEIFNEVESLKQKPANAVIEYVRRLKPAFNQGVAAQASNSDDCNTC